jgi:hypothetical protein
MVFSKEGASEYPIRRTECMDKSTHTCLCKGLKACGIPKELAYDVMNTITKWDSQNGPEWTLSRIKALRQWYETYLSGTPVPPDWFKHSKTNMPLGVWSRVFKLPTSKALGVLSCGTIYRSKEFSTSQQKKFLHGLEGSGCQDLEHLRTLVRKSGESSGLHAPHTRSRMPKIEFPTIFDMNGSVPIHDGRSTIRPLESKAGDDGNIIQPSDPYGDGLEALVESWESVPQVTFDFLVSQNLEGYLPLGVLGNEWAMDLNKPHSTVVGRVSVLQEPELKARVVANPNRVMQVTLEPLKTVFMEAANQLPTDCTFDQDSGVRWAQKQLRSHVTLAGSDLTSASDLLDLEGCLRLVEWEFHFSQDIKGYRDFAKYFFEVSRSAWWCPSLNREVHWSAGDPLGTGPSFGLLTLANNAAARVAVRLQRHDAIQAQEWSSTNYGDYFRVIGDDIIMRKEVQPYYEMVIRALGGEINHSKTLTSDKVAEFAGRIITRDAVYMKRIKYDEPSDASFMSYMSQLGDQAKYFLKPRQRKVYDFFKYVPGIAVEGPWIKDSYGIPFDSRYQWYLSEVQPAFAELEPDRPKSDYDMVLLKATLSRAQANKPEYDCVKDMAQPYLDEGYLPSQVTTSFKIGGDPRLTKSGKNTLQVLEDKIGTGAIKPFVLSVDPNTTCDPKGASSTKPISEKSETWENPMVSQEEPDDDYDLEI